MKPALFILLLVVTVLYTAGIAPSPRPTQKHTLSEYGFFEGPLSALDPAPGVVPYDLNTPLFSNYAEKLRFVKLPAGTQARYKDSSVFEFPVGTILIKNFFYYNDFRRPEKGRKIMETRLLVHEASGWNALPYIWNEEQTEAYYDPAGENIAVKYTNTAGRKVQTSYLVPNKNQCKGCHLSNQTLLPIGPVARQLNREYPYPTGTENQLKHWQGLGILTNLPERELIPRTPVWDQPSTGTTEERARAYLDVNCGHCHSDSGPASTSGLFLDVFERDRTRLGINKSPVAAGRGAGNLSYDIVPGQPRNSILVFRMKTNDPAIAMPEIGREQIHEEGVDLIEAWIRTMSDR